MTPDQRLLANVVGFLVAVLLLVGGGAWAGYAWRDRGAKADLAECQRVHAEALAITLRTAQQAEASYRAKEAATAAEHQRIARDAQTETAQARADADRFRAALDRLRKQAAAAATSGGAAPADSGPATGSQTARAPGDLPPELLFRALEAAGDIAAFADHSRIAGSSCERSYQALTPKP
jgi:hypothetical protein